MFFSTRAAVAKHRCMILLLITALMLPIGAQMEEKKGTVTATSLYVRNAADADADTLCSIKNGTKVTVLSTSGDWYKIKVGSTTGYAAKKYISIGSSTSSSATSSSSGDLGTIASLGKAPATCKPGDTSDDVLKLQKALTIAGYYNGRLSGHYGDVTKEAVEAFQKKKNLSTDGVAGEATIKALFGKAASDAGTSSSKKTYKTEKLDWFGGGSSTIKDGGQFTIKDVATGKTFTAQRRYGSNHMDAEPKNKTETATMKAIYGGSWSWRRRAILVQYNGHVYAASMNGMPHAEEDDSIKNNDFDGVFCVHFYGSKTHGSDKVDSEHQNAVAKAMKATW